MFHNQGASRQSCSLLAVVCGKAAEYDQKSDVKDGTPRYCFPEIVSSGRLEVSIVLKLFVYNLSCFWLIPLIRRFVIVLASELVSYVTYNLLNVGATFEKPQYG